MSAEPDPEELTRLLEAVRTGSVEANERLFAGIYDRLRALARREFRRESGGHTLQPTALVNEAWMRLADRAGGFENRTHFFRAAALAMRRILIDHARGAQAQKRGSGQQVVTLGGVEGDSAPLSVLEVEDALQALEKHDARLAEVCQLRFFGGLTIEEVAQIQGTSPATVKRDWVYARAWLFRQMGEDDDV